MFQSSLKAEWCWEGVWGEGRKNGAYGLSFMHYQWHNLPTPVTSDLSTFWKADVPKFDKVNLFD